MLPYYMFCTDAEDATYIEEEGKMIWVEQYDEEEEWKEEHLSIQQAIEVARYNNMRLVLDFHGHELELFDYTELREY